MDNSGPKTKGMLFVFFSSIFHQNWPPENLRKIEEIQCYESWLVLLLFQDEKRKENPKFFCWSTGNSHSLARSSPNVVAFVRDFFGNSIFLGSRSRGSCNMPVSTPTSAGWVLAALEEKSRTIVFLQLYCSFLVQLLTE